MCVTCRPHAHSLPSLPSVRIVCVVSPPLAAAPPSPSVYCFFLLFRICVLAFASRLSFLLEETRETIVLPLPPLFPPTKGRRDR